MAKKRKQAVTLDQLARILKAAGIAPKQFEKAVAKAMSVRTISGRLAALPKARKKKPVKEIPLDKIKPYVRPELPDRDGDPEAYAQQMQADVRNGKRRPNVIVVGGWDSDLEKKEKTAAARKTQKDSDDIQI